jgi:hypothetical protein
MQSTTVRNRPVKVLADFPVKGNMNTSQLRAIMFTLRLNFKTDEKLYIHNFIIIEKKGLSPKHLFLVS